jgi:hypothetical protein
MLEYVFFHKVLADKFSRAARNLGIETALIEDEPAWEVHLPEDMDEQIEVQLSEMYDELFDQDQEMYDQENADSEEDYGAAAIEITLANDDKVYAQTDQKIMGKVLSVLTFDELNRLIEDIVFAVENPDTRTICQRYRDMVDG